MTTVRTAAVAKSAVRCLDSALLSFMSHRMKIRALTKRSLGRWVARPLGILCRRFPCEVLGVWRPGPSHIISIIYDMFCLLLYLLCIYIYILFSYSGLYYCQTDLPCFEAQKGFCRHLFGWSLAVDGGYTQVYEGILWASHWCTINLVR